MITTRRAWHLPASRFLIHLTVIVGLLIYGFVISLGGRRLFSDTFES